ncbi:hypothetical protein [Amycolatopsis jejuensis]|uniref:hypothetical protein n=1 Tax=Amycolatopsis jejuensis TaxID=330084 RepID=UPI000524D19B|nr:hypothetical protein [Amycolatopsis jejuensis]
MPREIPRLTPLSSSVLAGAIAAGDGEATAALLLESLAREGTRARAVLDDLGLVLPAGPPGRDPAELPEILATAAEMAHATGEAGAATHHLLAAMVERGHLPELTALGLTADLVLARGARIETADDVVREAIPEPLDLTAAAPVPPQPEDLSRRTTSRRSAANARLLTIGLPSGRRGNSPLGRRRIRQFVVVWAVQQLTAYAAFPLLLMHASATGQWWTLVLIVPFQYLPVGMGRWGHVLARVPVVIFAPVAVGVLALVNLLAVFAHLHLLVWFDRVEQREPRTPWSAVWRRYWKESQRMSSEVRQDGFWA